ncbi:lumenal Hsp70 protein, partial [Dispira parvispora]
MRFHLHTVTIGILGWALFITPAMAQSSVMGIDYGTDFFKVALAAPSKNLDIVLNRDYKRKTQSQVLVNDLVRHYGVDADSKFVRMTDKMYPAVKSILGRLFSDPSCATYRERYNNGMVEDPERHTPLFRQTDEVAYTPEQILAMQLQYARETATSEAGHLVSKAVITVPPFFDQFERQAVLDAADLAGVRAIALVNDGSAVAYTYAMGKTFAKPQNVLFYDVGAGSTTATLVKLGTNPKDDSTLVSMKSFGYDRTLGGFEIDVRLQKHLGDLFMKKFGDKLKGSVFDSPRALVKLLKEAHRVKHILSANTEAMSSIEGLEGHDFKVQVTREELENLTQDLVPRFTKPIDDALNSAKLTLKDVDTVVLVGGGVRIPFILNLLESHVGEGKIAKSVNGDEAAVMGATLYAASLTIPLRGKKLILRDMAPYPVE